MPIARSPFDVSADGRVLLRRVRGGQHSNTPTIVPRDPFGMPVQRTSILLSALPPAIANRVGQATASHAR
jgi:hypothetical protein